MLRHNGHGRRAAARYQLPLRTDRGEEGDAPMRHAAPHRARSGAAHGGEDRDHRATQRHGRLALRRRLRRLLGALRSPLQRPLRRHAVPRRSSSRGAATRLPSTATAPASPATTCAAPRAPATRSSRRKVASRAARSPKKGAQRRPPPLDDTLAQLRSAFDRPGPLSYRNLRVRFTSGGRRATMRREREERVR